MHHQFCSLSLSLSFQNSQEHFQLQFIQFSLFLPCQTPFLLWSHLLPCTGAIDTSKQSIDHLDETEDKLHACCHKQSGKQSQAEFNHILWNFTPCPYLLVSQVAPITGKYKNQECREIKSTFLLKYYYMNTILITVKIFRTSVHKNCLYLLAKGVPHFGIGWSLLLQQQSGPLARPTAATLRLYIAPITPAAAKAMDRNICMEYTQLCQCSKKQIQL